MSALSTARARANRGSETEGRSTEELREIARICRKVPAEPSDTFQEAVQAWWFAHLCIFIELNGRGISALCSCSSKRSAAMPCGMVFVCSTRTSRSVRGSTCSAAMIIFLLFGRMKM